MKRLQLVSLLKYDSPQVYVLDEFPRMDRLDDADAPTRELDDFESRSLKQLTDGEEIVVEDIDVSLRMNGVRCVRALFAPSVIT